MGWDGRLADRQVIQAQLAQRVRQIRRGVGSEQKGPGFLN